MTINHKFSMHLDISLKKTLTSPISINEAQDSNFFYIQSVKLITHNVLRSNVTINKHYNINLLPNLKKSQKSKNTTKNKETIK